MKKFDELLKEGEVEDFIDSSELQKKVFKQMRIDVNDVLMKTLIAEMQKKEKSLKKKFGLGKDARMKIDNFGTAYLHDIYMQMIGEAALTFRKFMDIDKLGLK